VIAAAALPGLPEIRPGDDLGGLLAGAAGRLEGGLTDADIVVISHKVVSKAEGRIVYLEDVVPGERAVALAAEHDKDARAVQVVLDESAELVRADRGRLISRTRHGFVCANAGVDASNAGQPGTLVMLPLDPDASARALRATLRAALGVAPAIVISDTFGRPWRHGQAEVAIGCAGLEPLDDWRGRPDASGRELDVTIIAIADEVAAAADLARGKDTREPAVRVQGLGRHVRPDDGPGIAGAVVRPLEEDLFR
jgi:coenzyme F420-0:L-glutamate ligase/coenzyme F420-1:gamma-L-glutamate ligase